MKDARHDALLWKCRRGMLELDILLTQYIEKFYHTASEDDILHFIALLEEADTDLFAWLMGNAEPKPEFTSLVDKIRHAHQG